MPSIAEPALWEVPLAVIGDEDRVAGFKALGFKVYALNQPPSASPRGEAEFKDVLDKVAAQQCAVCLVQEDIYQREEERINSYRNDSLPVFIPLMVSGVEPLMVSGAEPFSPGGKMDLPAASPVSPTRPSASPRGELGKIIQGIRLRATGTY